MAADAWSLARPSRGSTPGCSGRTAAWPAAEPERQVSGGRSMNGSAFLDVVISRYRELQQQCDRAIAQVPRERWAYRLDPESNSLVTLMLHISGNFLSRWSDFLASDGEKPDRDRDSEFEDAPAQSPEAILERWAKGWKCLFDSLSALTRGGSRAHRHDPFATPHGRRSHSAQPDPYGWPCWPDRLPGQASGRSGLADPEHSPRALGRVQASHEEESARGLTCRRGRLALARAWRRSSTGEGGEATSDPSLDDPRGS